MEIWVVQEGSENDNRRVFFHLTKAKEQWLIDCIDDGYNRLGDAPASEDKALKNSPDYQK